MRFHHYNPINISKQFQKFADEVIPYQARDGFAWKEHPMFITQDEIDPKSSIVTSLSLESLGRISSINSRKRLICLNLSDRKSTRLNSSHVSESRMPSSA